MALKEGQFRLGSLLFGTPEDDVIILEDGLDTGSPGLRTNDVANPVGDGNYFGRDYLDGPTWAFTLGVRDDKDVYARLANLAKEWRNEDIRTYPGADSILRFTRNGRPLRVYGRPRQFGVTPSRTSDSQWQIVECDFKVSEPFAYDDVQGSATAIMGMAMPLAGLVLPEDLSWTLGENVARATGVANVLTIEPTPFRLRIVGPASGAMHSISVTGNGWAFDIDETIQSGQVAVIDTRDMTARINGRGSIAGALSRRSRLNARLINGSQAFTLTASGDTTGGRAELYWHGAEPIL